MDKAVLWDRIGDACDRLRDRHGAWRALVALYRWLDWADRTYPIEESIRPQPPAPLRVYPEEIERACELNREWLGEAPEEKQKPINKNLHKGKWPLAGA